MSSHGVPRGLARHARALALRWRARLSARQIGLVLVYHRVGETDDRSTEISRAVDVETFEQHLRHLRSRYRVVPVSAILAAVTARRRGGRIPVALTFDDDLTSHAERAAPLLRRYGLPAAFFVCGASLSAPHAFWWEDLQRGLDEGLLGEELPYVARSLVAAARAREPGAATALAAAVEELTPERRQAVAESLRALVGAPPPDAGLRAPQVRALADAGFDVGFHTLRHDRLPDLDGDALAAAMCDGRNRLGGVVGQALRLIAYPHGRADERVAAAARAAGFGLGLAGGERAVLPDDDPLLVPRVEPRASAAGAFAVVLARFVSGRLAR